MTKKKRIALLCGSIGAVLIMAGIAVAFFLLRGKPELLVDRSEVALYVGESTILHVDAKEDHEIVWSSADEEIATVYHGMVKAVAVGETTVTVSSPGFETKTVSVTVSPGPLEGYEDVVTYVGEPPVDIRLSEDKEYVYKVERYEEGEYTEASGISKDGMISTEEAGYYRVTYTMDENQYARYVRVNPLREYKDFAVLEAFDGFSPVKTAASQYSEVELGIRGSEKKTQFITCGTEEEKAKLHEELQESGYHGYLENDSVARVEQSFARNENYGSYLYLDITPEVKTFFDHLDEFDEDACLSLWYRLMIDEEKNGEYQAADTTYNFLAVENAEGIVRTENYYNKAVGGSESGWMNWKISFSDCKELVGARRILIAIGRWGHGGAGTMRCDFYSLEAESGMLDAALGKTEAEYKWGDDVPYQLPSFSIPNLNQDDFAVYDGNGRQMTEGDEADYQKKKFNNRQWLVNLPIGTYEFRYRLTGTGLKTEENGVSELKIPVTIQNPSLAGIVANGELDYYVSHDWQGYIGSEHSSGVKTAKTEQMSDADYAALLEAGYAGAIEGRTYNTFRIGTEMQAENQARSVGLLFPKTVNGKLEKLIKEERIQNNYHLSVWIRISNDSYQTCSSKIWTSVYDRNAKRQSNARTDDENYSGEYTFQSGQWVEIQIPVRDIISAYNEFSIWNRGAAEQVFGVALPWLMVGGNEFKSPVTVDVFGAEIMYNDIYIKAGENADVKADPILYNDSAELSFELYQDGKQLTKGRDYKVLDGTVIAGLTEERYVVEYTGMDGVLHFKRRIFVEQKQNVLNTVLAEDGIGYYTSHDWQGSINTPNTYPAADTEQTVLSDQEYKKLLEAGYTGLLSGKTVSRITIDMGEMKANNAARTVGILFTKADSQNLKQYVMNEKASEDYYVSVWVKMNYKSEFHTQAMVVDRYNVLQANGGAGDDLVTVETDRWTELRIPLTYVKEAYANFNSWYGDTTTEELPGVWIDWLMVKDGDAYPDDLQFTLEVYGAEIKYNGIEAKRKEAADISIRTDMIAPGLPYTYEIWNADKALTEGVDYRVDGSRIAFEEAGDYMVKYIIDTPKDIYKNDFVVTRPFTVKRPQEVPNLGIGKAGLYYTSHDWKGSINTPNTNPIETAGQTELSDEEYAALLAAGYAGVSEDRHVNHISIDMDAQKAGNAARTVGILLPDTLDGKLKAYAKNDRLQEDYYVSVWMKMNVSSSVNTSAMVVDRQKKLQTNSDEQIAMTFEADQWTEIKIPLSYIANVYGNFNGWYVGASEELFGVWLDWLKVKDGDAYPDGTILNIDIYGAELQYQGITGKEDEEAEISVHTDILKPGMNYTWEIFEGEKRLTAGSDYTAAGNRVVMKKAGVYKIKYTVVTPVEDYQTDFVFCRSLIVKGLKDVPELSLGHAGLYYTSHDWWGSINTPNTNPMAASEKAALSEEDYQALLASGFVGNDDRSVSRITIDMDVQKAGNAARTVGIFFPDMLNGELKAIASNPDIQKDYYMSLWVKMNVSSSANAAAVVVDRAEKKQANSGNNVAMTFEAGKWTELKIPLSDIAQAYGNFNDWYQGTTEELFGVWFDWLMVKDGDAYPAGTILSIDVSNAQIEYQALTVEEGQTVDISIRTDILEAGMDYTWEIYKAGKKLVSGVDYQAEGNKVSLEKTGVYTVVYTVVTSEEEYRTNLILYRNLTVEESRNSQELPLGKAGLYYTSHDWHGGINTPNTNPVANTDIAMISDEDYEALLAAGFAGMDGDRNANRIVIDMDMQKAGNAARTVGIFFPDMLNGELKALAADGEAQEKYYVSLWIKMNVASSMNVSAAVVDREKKLQANSDEHIAMTFEAGRWTEIRIPLSYITNVYGNFNGWYTDTTEELFGVWFDWLMVKDGDAYPAGTTLTIDIYGATVREKQSLTRAVNIVKAENFLKKKRALFMLSK